MLMKKLYTMNHITRKEEDWLVIVNPNAGQGKGKKDWNKISSLLNKFELSSKVYFTEKKLHAIELTKEGIAAGFRKIITVGGDGTMNEVVNGAFIQTTCPTEEIILGMITVGTGNDWGKMFGIPSDYEGAVKIIKEYKVFTHDAGVITYYSGTELEKRYFLNIAGLGFDAVVVKRTNAQKDKGRSGKTIYFYNLLMSLLGYKSTRTEVNIDGLKIANDTFTISIGIGIYSGGGMRQTPFAIPDDGLFDITVIGNMSKFEIVRNLSLLYNGKILEHPKIKGYKGKNIKIDSDRLIYVESDGESLGHTPVEFNIIPKSINIVSGKRVTQ
jgi:YegS/Rv2252/BmrU family lipid kinase